MTIGENLVIKILITGPESSGKTSLSKMISAYFNCPMVEEYAREFLAKTLGYYRQEDLTAICRGQIQNEKKALKSAYNESSKLIVCDTGPEVIKIWSEVKYATCSAEIEQYFQQSNYDLVLLCKPEFEWEADALREYPKQEDRDKLYLLYKQLLFEHNIDFVEMTGNHSERKKQAITEINQTLNKKII